MSNAAATSGSMQRPGGLGGGAPGARVWGLFSRSGLVATVLLTGAFVGLYFRWFLTQGEMSSKKMEDWGHAFVIPLISGYVIWLRREAIARCPIRAYWPGLIPLLLGAYAYFFFLVGLPNHMLAGGAMLLALFGAVACVGGTALLKHVFAPIAFLGFGVTISERIMTNVTFKLQMISSDGAFVLLSLLGAALGFSTEVEGNVLTVTTAAGVEHAMNVAEACSGIRMVVAFVALSGAVALIGCNEWWKRSALLLISVPVAVFMNVIRVTVLGLLTLRDPRLAEGQAHMLIGVLLLVPSLLLFMGVLWALNRVVKSEGTP